VPLLNVIGAGGAKASAAYATDGYTTTQPDGSFVFEPWGLTTGLHTIRARAAVWDENLQRLIASDWDDEIDYNVGKVTFTLLEPPNEAVTVTTLGLQHRIGTTQTNLPIATSPALFGTLANDGSVSYLTVQFDHDGTDNVETIDGTTLTDANGNFTYLPSSLSLGTRTIRARGVEWDYVHQEPLAGDWISFAFEYVEDVNNAPVIESLALLSPTGPNAGETANATIVGQVSDDRSAAGLTIEFDHNDDGVVDGVAATDDDGRFRYVPVALAYSSSTSPTTIRARAVDRELQWDEDDEQYIHLASDWSDALSFVYHAPSGAAPVLVSLETTNPPPGADPSRRSLQGNVISENSLKGITVEFDFDEDGTVDQTATTDDNGRFALQPHGLTVGSDVHFKVRVRETDPLTHQLRSSGWIQKEHFSYTAIVAPQVEVDSLALLHDTGTGGNEPDLSTTDPTVTGTINHAGQGQFVIVQFSLDDDFASLNGQVVVGNDLHFTYRPTGLAVGNVTLYARTKDVDHNGTVIYSAPTAPFTFHLEELADQPLIVSQLSLDEDTGNSDHDLSTADATVKGQIAGFRSSETLTIQIDFNNDGVADLTVAPEPDGSFSFEIEHPVVGLNTVTVRAIGVSGASSRTGDWRSFSFVYAPDDLNNFNDGPDSAAAQQVVPAAVALNTTAAASGAGYNSALSQAEATRRQATANASNTYDSALAGALSTRNTDVNSAEQTYELELATAGDVYTVAIDDAAAALADQLNPNSVNYFGGDPTSYYFQPFSWAPPPPVNHFQIPDDASQAPRPVGSPQYSGPTFQYHSDPQYQQAIAAFELAYHEAVKNANSELVATKNTAALAFGQQSIQITSEYRQTMAQAEQAYVSNLLDNTGEPFDVKERSKQYRDDLNNTANDYQDTLMRSAASYGRARRSADEALDGEIASAHQTYRDASDEAQRVYDDANKDTPEDERSATIAFREALFNSARQRDTAIADASRTHDKSVNDALRDWKKSNAASWATYQTTISDITATFQKDVAQYSRWVAMRPISAHTSFQEAKVDGARVKSEGIADAGKDYADAIAAAEYTRSRRADEALVAYWRGEIAARLAAYDRWNNAIDTPWTSYQRDIVAHEQTYINSRADAYLSRSDSLASAALTQAQDINTAAKARADAESLASYESATAIINATVAYRSAVADEQEAQADRDADSRRDFSAALAALGKTYSQGLVDRSHTFADATSKAYNQADQDQIDASQFRVDDEPVSSAWYDGGPYTDRNDSIRISAALQDDLADAWNTFSLHKLDDALAYRKARMDASADYNSEINDSNVSTASNLAAVLATYQKATATAAASYAIVSAQADGDQLKAAALASVTYVTVQVDEDYSYSEKNALYLKTEHIADATSETAFVSAVATSYVMTIESWSNGFNGGLGTPWSNYQYALAVAEVTRDIDTADAKLAYVTAVSTADYRQTTDVAAATKTLEIAKANASKARTFSVVNSEVGFAAGLAAIRLNYAKGLADAIRENAELVSEDGAQMADDASDFNLENSKSALDADTAFAKAFINATHKAQDSAIDAWADFAMNDSADPDEHATAYQHYQDALQGAWETYQDSIRQASESLRHSRANRAANVATFYGDHTADGRRRAANEQAALVLARSDLDIMLADATFSATIVLTSGIGRADFTFATTLAAANYRFDKSLADADYDHQMALDAAERAQTVAFEATNPDTGEPGINPAYREATVAARGTYEWLLFTNHAIRMADIATTSASAIAIYQAAVAQQDALQADARRVAKSTFEHAITEAAVDYTRTTLAAEADLASRSLAADKTYAYAFANNTQSLSNSLAAAERTLYVQASWARAEEARADAVAGATYDAARMDAAASLENRIANADAAYTQALAAAQIELNLAETDPESPNSPSQGPPPQYYGGWGFGYYDGYGFGKVNWRFNWAGGSGGYVFGPADSDGFSDWTGWYGVDDALASSFTLSEHYHHDEDASAAFGLAVIQAGEERGDAIRLAQETYVNDIGGAKTTLAASVGQAGVVSATSGGIAATTYQQEVGNARRIFVTQNNSAAVARLRTISAAQINDGARTAEAERRRVTSEENANVVLTDQLGEAAVVAAHNVAVSDALYQYALAQYEANQLGAIANPTDQQAFDALTGSAKVAWIAALTTPNTPDTSTFVVHATAVALAHEYIQPHFLAEGWKARQLARADADDTFAMANTRLITTTSADELTYESDYASAVQLAQNTRNSGFASNQGAFEIAVAAADADAHFDVAVAEKDYQLAKLAHEQSSVDAGLGSNIWDSEASDSRKADYADAELRRAASVASARYQFHLGENARQKGYSNSLALAERTRINGSGSRPGQAQVAKTESTSQADYQLALDAAYAQADEGYWTVETAATVTARYLEAQADVGFWSAEEAANVLVTEAIDETLDIPWTHFLLDLAAAHQQWWGNALDPTSAANTYLQWIAYRNAAEGIWQMEVNNGHAQFAANQRSSANYEIVSVANATFTAVTAEANAAYDYMAGQSGILAPAKTYLDDIAAAGRQLEIDLALAKHDWTLTADDDQYSADVAAAQTDYSSTVRDADTAYGGVVAPALAAKLDIDDYAENDIRVAIASARYGREIGDAWSTYSYSVNAAAAYATLIVNQAGIDRAYWLTQSASLSAMADSLADFTSPTASPWMTYYASSGEAYDSWTQVVAPVQETVRITIALARAGFELDGSLSGGGETGRAEAKRDLAVANTQADYDEATNLASWQLGIAVYQANAIVAMVSTGADRNIYPALGLAGAGNGFTVAIPTDDLAGDFDPANVLNPAGAPSLNSANLPLPWTSWHVNITGLEFANSSVSKYLKGYPSSLELLTAAPLSPPRLPPLPDPASPSDNNPVPQPLPPPIPPPEPEPVPEPAPEPPAEPTSQTVSTPEPAPETSIETQRSASEKPATHAPQKDRMTLGRDERKARQAPAPKPAPSPEKLATIARLKDAIQMAKFAVAGYEGKPGGNEEKLRAELEKEKWVIPLDEGIRTDPKSGFRATLFVHKDTGEAVLAFAGTDDLLDGVVDFNQGFGWKTQQYELANTLAYNYQLQYGSKLRLTGHSLGGGLATSAAAVYKIPTVTFNAAGVAWATLSRYGGTLKNANRYVDNYRVWGEPLSTIQNSVGLVMPDSTGKQYVLHGSSWLPILNNGHIMSEVLLGLRRELWKVHEQ
jgi:hypothetical protein